MNLSGLDFTVVASYLADVEVCATVMDFTKFRD